MSQIVNKRLMETRKNHKLSRRKFSNLSGFNERTIVTYENGSRKVSDKYIRFVSLYFNVSEEYMRGFKNENEEYAPLKRTLLMYQDIYNYSDMKMQEIFLEINFDYLQILKNSDKNLEDFDIETLEISRILNLKPSSFEYKIYDKELRKSQKLIENTLGKGEFKKHILIQEKKGILLNKDYYAEMIKNRNLAKDNYTPPKEIKEIPKNYQDILDLLPYASDKFLEDIHNKLKTMKEIQTL